MLYYIFVFFSHSTAASIFLFRKISRVWDRIGMDWEGMELKWDELGWENTLRLLRSSVIYEL